MKQKPINLYLGPAKTISPAALNELDASGRWIAEQKLDGSWIAVRVAGGRIVSAETRSGQPVDLSWLDAGELGDGMAVLVGEVVGQHLYLFDLVDRSAPYELRRAALERMVPGGQHVSIVRQWRSGFAAAFNEVIAARGEGLVVKRRDSLYGTRSKTADWLKCKPIVSVEFVAISSSVTADRRDQVSVGLYDGNRLIAIQTVPCASTCPRPVPGQVVEVEGSEIGENCVLRNAVATRIRTDKTTAECTVQAARAARPVMPEVEASPVKASAPVASEKPSKPAKPGRARKNSGFFVRVGDDELDAWRAMAASYGCSLSEWMRLNLNRAAGHRR